MNKKVLAVLIGAVIIIGAVLGGVAYVTRPAGHLSIDVNPSIEINFNRLNRVVNVEGINPEGEGLLFGQNYAGKEVDDVVESIIGRLLSNGYLTTGNAKLLFSADDSKLSRGLLTRINYSTVQWLREYYDQTEVFAQVVEDDDLEKAHKLGLSFGRYALLKELTDDLEGEDAEFISMKLMEIFEYAKANNIDTSKWLADLDDDDFEIDIDDLFDDDDDDDDDDMDDDDDDDDMDDDDDDDDMDDDDDDDMDDDDDDDMDDDDDDDMDDDDDDDMDDDDDDDRNSVSGRDDDDDDDMYDDDDDDDMYDDDDDDMYDDDDDDGIDDDWDDDNDDDDDDDD